MVWGRRHLENDMPAMLLLTKLNGSPSSPPLSSIGTVSLELPPLLDVSQLAARAVGNDVAYSRGISPTAVETRRVLFPTMSWTGKEKLPSCHNMGSS
jgi:hypothetical protein